VKLLSFPWWVPTTPRASERPVGAGVGHYAERVPADRPSLLDPSTIEPFELDLRRVFWVITGLWGVALIVTALIGLVSAIEGRTVVICATGFVLGFVALGWERWHFGRKRDASAGQRG